MKELTGKNRLKMNALKCLLEDPTINTNKLAEKLGVYRKTVLLKKKELEKNHTIWGYTTVIDESKLNHVLYIAQFRTKLISKAFVDLVIEMLTTGAPGEDDVRVIEVLYLNGRYDIIILFSAPDHTTARRYYEALRVVYKDFFLENSSLSDVNFSLVKEGKLNPELEKLHDFVPKID